MLNNIAIVGCGTMGQAILSGLIDSGILASLALRVTACVSHKTSADKLLALYGNSITVLVDNNLKACREADVVILSTKPQVAKAVLDDPDIKLALQGKLLISILAGVRIGQLEEWLPNTDLIRAMPNTPCKIREGMTVLSCWTTVSKEYQQFADSIFHTLGRCIYLDEKHLDAVTALSASGPAFACVVLEALADGGVMMGLPRITAIELAAQALQGAARMVLQTGQHPAMVKDSVTTPGGCTIAGLLTMEDGKIRSTLARTIQEATMVAASLGRKQDARDENRRS